jgi:HSP20 family protein
MDFRSLMPFGRSTLARAGSDADPFSSLRREMDRLFEDFSRGMPMALAPAAQGFLTPKINVSETSGGIELTADLPGVDQKDIELDLTENVLTLKASHQEEKQDKDEQKQYHVFERSSGTFMRRLALPFEADEQAVEASFQNGVLKVFVPRRAEPEKPAKKIEIKSG